MASLLVHVSNLDLSKNLQTCETVQHVPVLDIYNYGIIAGV